MQTFFLISNICELLTSGCCFWESSTNITIKLQQYINIEIGAVEIITDKNKQYHGDQKISLFGKTYN